MQHLSFSNNSITFSDTKGAAALFISLFFFIISLAGFAGIYAINKSQDTAQEQLIAQIQQKEDDLRPKLLDQVFALQKKLIAASSILNSHRFQANTFAVLERDVHPRIRFTSYSLSPKEHKISLTGEADNYTVLGEQIAFLQGDQQINKVDFGGLTIDLNNKVSFNLTVFLLPSATAQPQ